MVYNDGGFKIFGKIISFMFTKKGEGYMYKCVIAVVLLLLLITASCSSQEDEFDIKNDAA